MTTDRVCVGIIVGAQGIKGAVRLKSFTDDPLAIGDYGPVEDESGRRRFLLTPTGMAKGSVVARVEGIVDRNAAEALRGLKLYVSAASLPDLAEDEFYASDLVGLRAETKQGDDLGIVRAIYDFGAGDVLEVKRPDASLALFTFTKAVVPMVDVAGGRIVIDPPPEVEGEMRQEGQ